MENKSQASFLSDKLLLIAGVIGFIALYFIFYPSIYAFRDEGSYLAMAYVLKQGTLLINETNIPVSAHLWIEGKQVPFYALGNSLALIPFTLFSWKGAFLLGIVSHLVGCCFFKKLLPLLNVKSVIPVLLYLFFPAFIFYSRTMMSDIPSTAIFMAGCYFYFREKPSKGIAGILFGLNLLFRVTNVLLIIPFGLMLLWNAVTKKELKSLFSFSMAVLSFVLILAGLHTYLYGASYLTGYSPVFTGIKVFSMQTFWIHLKHYLVSLNLVYPMMLLVFLWMLKRQKIEVIFVSGIYLIFYSFYTFFDEFPGDMATRVLGTRFLFPVIPFLIMVYGDAIETFFKKLPNRLYPFLGVIVLIGGLASSLIVNSNHQRFLSQQQAEKDALYEVTEEGSTFLYDRNAEELVQHFWGNRKYVNFQEVQDVLDYLESADDEIVYLVTRKTSRGGVILDYVPDTDFKLLEERYVLLNVISVNGVKITRIVKKNAKGI